MIYIELYICAHRLMYLCSHITFVSNSNYMIPLYFASRDDFTFGSFYQYNFNKYLLY